MGKREPLSPEVVKLLGIVERGEDIHMSERRRTKLIRDVRRVLVPLRLARYHETVVAGGVWSSWQLTKKGLRAAEAGQAPVEGREGR